MAELTAIDRFAGPDLVHACRLLGGCRTGDAKRTPGYGLSASRIAIDTITSIIAPDEVVLVGFDHAAATPIRAVFNERS